MNETVRATANGHQTRQAVSDLLVDALAEWRQVAPHELDVCLYEYIDPEALNQLFRSPRIGLPRQGTVMFPLDDLLVTIDIARDDTVEVSVEPRLSGAGAFSSSTATSVHD